MRQLKGFVLVEAMLGDDLRALTAIDSLRLVVPSRDRAGAGVVVERCSVPLVVPVVLLLAAYGRQPRRAVP